MSEQQSHEQQSRGYTIQLCRARYVETMYTYLRLTFGVTLFRWLVGTLVMCIMYCTIDWLANRVFRTQTVNIPLLLPQ